MQFFYRLFKQDVQRHAQIGGGADRRINLLQRLHVPQASFRLNEEAGILNSNRRGVGNQTQQVGVFERESIRRMALHLHHADDVGFGDHRNVQRRLRQFIH